MQTCIWPSWCHCHSLSLASLKSRLVLPFWYRLTRVIPKKGPLNGCVCVCVWLIIFITLLNFTSRQRGARCGDECVCISVYLSARISHTQTAIFSVRVPCECSSLVIWWQCNMYVLPDFWTTTSFHTIWHVCTTQAMQTHFCIDLGIWPVTLSISPGDLWSWPVYVLKMKIISQFV